MVEQRQIHNPINRCSAFSVRQALPWEPGCSNGSCPQGVGNLLGIPQNNRRAGPLAFWYTQRAALSFQLKNGKKRSTIESFWEHPQFRKPDLFIISGYWVKPLK